MRPLLEYICLNCRAVFVTNELPTNIEPEQHRHVQCPHCEVLAIVFADATGLVLLQRISEVEDWMAVCSVCNRDLWSDQPFDPSNQKRRARSYHPDSSWVDFSPHGPVRVRAQRRAMLIEHTKKPGVPFGKYTRCPGSDVPITSRLGPIDPRSYRRVALRGAL